MAEKEERLILENKTTINQSPSAPQLDSDTSSATG